MCIVVYHVGLYSTWTGRSTRVKATDIYKPPALTHMTSICPECILLCYVVINMCTSFLFFVFQKSSASTHDPVEYLCTIEINLNSDLLVYLREAEYFLKPPFTLKVENIIFYVCKQVFKGGSYPLN